MPTPPLDIGLLKEAVTVTSQLGNVTEAAKFLKIPRTTLVSRITSAELKGFTVDYSLYHTPKGRKLFDIKNGSVIVFGDAHYWPGYVPVAHRGLVHLIKRIKPKLIVCHGDVLDGATISRHPPIGWESMPSLQEELETVQERLHEIATAHKAKNRLWLIGNHDARFETKLAAKVPEFTGVRGIHLKDHFPDWTPGWSCWVNDDVVIKHRYKGGLHAQHNNTVSSGKHMVCGHLHSAKVTPWTDYNGTRWGVDTGCIADTYHDAFQGYMEDNPRNWRSGFAVLTFRDGVMLQPELCLSYDRDHVQFRGEVIEV